MCKNVLLFAATMQSIEHFPIWMCRFFIRSFYKKEEENPKLLTDYQSYQARQTIKMTHIEVFTYDVINENEEKGAYPVLFDYKKRSPLTNDAKAVFVQL